MTNIKPIVFDGKAFAKRFEEKILTPKVQDLKKRGITPRVAVIMSSDDPASHLYVKLKKQAAERVGIDLEIFNAYGKRRDHMHFMRLIGMFNRDPNTHGIMVQLPLAKRFKQHEKRILKTIEASKDVDGLTEEAMFLPATVKAVLTIVQEIEKQVLLRKPPHIFIAGNQGVVGSKVGAELTRLGYPVKGYDKSIKTPWTVGWGLPSFMSINGDILISATGHPGLVTADHVASGAAVIDVGSPQGDVRFEEVLPKVSFITPVPGGVGPLTVVSLLENVVEAAYNHV